MGARDQIRQRFNELSPALQQVARYVLDHPNEVDFRTDIYSLGITTFQSITGRLPFPDDNAERCANAHRYQPVPAIRRNVPQPVVDCIHWMLAKERDRRPASYDELDSVLEALTRPG